MRPPTHGEAHKRFDVEEMGESAIIYANRAYEKLRPGLRHKLQKTLTFATNYGMGYFVRYKRFDIPYAVPHE
jgi:hypothetical protein